MTIHDKPGMPVPPGHRTWHMAPVEVWEAQKALPLYCPESWEQDLFIHCTDDPAELLAVGNRYYASDVRPWLALRIECDRIVDPVIYEDSMQMFPHIYGHLPVTAVVDVVTLKRDELGRFVGIGDSSRED